MRLYNYSHPLTDAQRDELAIMFSLKAEEIEEIKIPVQIDHAQQLAPQIKKLMPTDDRGSATERLWIIPPGYSPAAAVLVTEMLHEYGGFIHMIRLRPKTGPITGYEVAEVIIL
jgi:hypothetical protein